MSKINKFKFQINRLREYFEHGRNRKFINEQSGLQMLRNSHAGKRCFIIGNGPSINKMDLNLMKNDVSFACNAFFLKFDELEFKPTYYTVEDPCPAMDNRDTLNGLQDSTFLIPRDLKKVITPRENVIYIPFRRYYVHFTSEHYPYFSSNALESVFWGGTVLFMNIQLASYMGFDEIILIGVDLTYKIPDQIIQNGNRLTSVEDDPNHFHPEYFGKGKQWHLPEVDRMQKAFATAEKTLRKQGKHLYNATAGGNLKEVTRVDYESLFKDS